ncbi:hypothetical protein [Parapedobacter tibetensis]|uniref:hypothetical protein n=1 Tax=Parapedobacter tibetensis TaxID=2972951 RepID=UPI00214DAD34|nr:hypothetical protein [Parapedobacter tibetensis]
MGGFADVGKVSCGMNGGARFSVFSRRRKVAKLAFLTQEGLAGDQTLLQYGQYTYTTLIETWLIRG